MKKISWLILLISMLLIAGCSSSSQKSSSNESAKGANAEVNSDYPEKPIEMIAPFPAGSSYDTAARILSKYMEKYLPNDQPVVVVNKPGGNNTIGVIDVFKAKPDGYTIGFVPTSTITTEPHYGNTPYTHDSFQAIARVLQVDGYLYVKSDSPWKSYEEWLEYAKKNQFSISTVPGAQALLNGLKEEAGLNLKIVPFDGFAEAKRSLLGGHVQGLIAAHSAVQAELESGDLRPLFSSTGRETKDGLPTLKEKGISIEENKMTGVIAPKGLPEDIKNMLEDAVKKALEDPEMQKEYENVSLEPFYGDAEEFQKALTDNFYIDEKILKAAKLIK